MAPNAAFKCFLMKFYLHHDFMPLPTPTNRLFYPIKSIEKLFDHSQKAHTLEGYKKRGRLTMRNLSLGMVRKLGMINLTSNILLALADKIAEFSKYALVKSII